MPNVTKKLRSEFTVGNDDGEFVVENEIPANWADYLGADVVLQSQKGWVANVTTIFTGSEPFPTNGRQVVRCLRRNGGSVEPVPNGTTVDALVVLHGETE